ncbi:MAG: hypothetical protein GSR80_000248 [Desulfurococcales archaeon]|nr:hypothetical protein [Desulfurococcales archaeon]
MAARSEGRKVEAAERREWLRVTEADRAALEDYVSEATGLGC